MIEFDKINIIQFFQFFQLLGRLLDMGADDDEAAIRVAGYDQFFFSSAEVLSDTPPSTLVRAAAERNMK